MTGISRRCPPMPNRSLRRCRRRPTRCEPPSSADRRISHRSPTATTSFAGGSGTTSSTTPIRTQNASTTPLARPADCWLRPRGSRRCWPPTASATASTTTRRSRSRRPPTFGTPAPPRSTRSRRHSTKVHARISHGRSSPTLRGRSATLTTDWWASMAACDPRGSTIQSSSIRRQPSGRGAFQPLVRRYSMHSICKWGFVDPTVDTICWSRCE